MGYLLVAKVEGSDLDGATGRKETARFLEANSLDERGKRAPIVIFHVSLKMP